MSNEIRTPVTDRTSQTITERVNRTVDALFEAHQTVGAEMADVESEFTVELQARLKGMMREVQQHLIDATLNAQREG